MQFFATAARGTEPALRDELRRLRLRGVRADRGGVHFGGDDVELVEGARACLESRLAVRILLQVTEGDARDGEELYDLVRDVDWSPWISPSHTLAVSAVTRASALTHTQFISQRTKDGIVDQQRDAKNVRSSVDTHDADVRVFVHLVRDHATVYLDLAGDSLHRRGYRTRIGEAPLKETLAAAMIVLSGWDRASPFHDPMCGSGTLAVEADWMARDVAPGLLRERFGFERWASHDDGMKRRVAALREALRARIREDGPPIVGTDDDPRMIELARENAKAARSKATFETASIDALSPSAPRGTIVTNPPYGERLDADEPLYRAMGEAFRRMKGWEVAVLSGTPALERAIKMRHLKSIPLWNGAIECRLLVYSIPP